jgi:Uma2 family endonuclease
MALPTYHEVYSIKDYMLWEGDWELIEGVPFSMSPSPKLIHQQIAARITRFLSELFDSCAKCQVLYELDWHIGEKTIVRPDCIVICYEPDGDYITRRPEIIFEIVSESTAGRDEILKKALYCDEGVPYYTLIYPEAKTAKCFKLVETEYKKVADFSTGKFIFTLPYCDIEFDFGLIWPKKSS